jgi:uracil-DNA glycosylase family 4
MLQLSSKFDALVNEVQSCTRCPSMAGCTRVLSWANGDPSADVMFIGEAPGRLGADRTAIPFHGDAAGDNFERLLELAGVARRRIFVTNAVLCNPRDGSGNNATPTKEMVRNCSENLNRQIEEIDPQIVVTLGAAALEGTRLVERHDLTLSGNVRTKSNWNGRTLIPLYHPGARAMIHRNFAAQTADYYFVGEAVRRLQNRPRTKANIAKPASEAWDVVKYVIASLGECSLFKLHKTMFLIDYESMKTTGNPITDFVYIRQKDGPYCVELGSRWFKAFASQISVLNRDGKPFVIWNDRGLFGRTSDPEMQAKGMIDVMVESLRGLSDSQIKTRSYLTAPMKASLRAERAGSSQLNRPLL